MSKTVLVGVTSGIAAFKSLDLIKLLRADGFEVKVIMTESAKKMVPIEEFERVSEYKVYSNLFEAGFDYTSILKERKVEHIELADQASVLVIVPATANVIAKLAHGIADDFLTTTALAVTAPIIVCPSMNVNMWNNPVVQENVSKLKKLGMQIIEPASGMLACGYEGKGRLENIAVIKEEIIKQLERANSLKDKKIVISAGGTIEKIDDVRYITNRSSGKMGVALAQECYLRGADVLLLRAKDSVVPRYPIREEVFSTAADLLQLVKQNIGKYEIFFHAAAVSDFTVEKPLTGKVSSKKSVTLTLQPQVKILDQVKKLNPRIKLIGFKAEHGLSENQLVEVAFNRLKECDADAIIANDISQPDKGFESDSNEVLIVSKDKSVLKINKALKKDIAKAILDFLFSTKK